MYAGVLLEGVVDVLKVGGRGAGRRWKSTSPATSRSTLVGEVAIPCRVDFPANVTRAFWAEQLRLLVFILATIAVPTSGMEKMACAWAIRRGMASPSVTLLMTLLLPGPDIAAVVQPAPGGTVQSSPV